MAPAVAAGHAGHFYPEAVGLPIDDHTDQLCLFVHGAALSITHDR